MGFPPYWKAIFETTQETAARTATAAIVVARRNPLSLDRRFHGFFTSILKAKLHLECFHGPALPFLTIEKLFVLQTVRWS